MRKHSRAQRLLEDLEDVFDHAFGAENNPWRHLGALSFYFFWIIVASGVYVYAVFDTSVGGAFQAVQRLTREQWYLGGVMRSLHRYASDALVITILLHALREFVNGHFGGFRWFSWVSGVVLIWLVYAAGIGGYWLVWDQLAQFSLTATSEWLDWLPLFGEPLVRNFLSADSISDRFFSLLIFLHIGVPLILLLGMWIHIQRISRARTNPPKVLAWGSLIALLVLSLAKPVVSQEPANLQMVPLTLNLDWLYHFIHPMMYASSAGIVWAIVAAGTLVLLMLPMFGRGERQPVAEVNLANCNGCGRCFADCPYAAVIMQPRTDNKPHPRQAVVLSDLCASCGICAGACPSSTPFRRAAQLVTGIDMPQLRISELRADLEEAIAKLAGCVKVVAFGCDCAADVSGLQGQDTGAFSLICIGMLPASFIEYALRAGADGVLITGCRAGDCEYRLGDAWAKQRIRGEREPHLRKSVPLERVRFVSAGDTDQDALRQELEDFRAALGTLEQASAALSPPARQRKTSYG